MANSASNEDAAEKAEARRLRKRELENRSRRADREAIDAAKKARLVSAVQFEPRPPTEAELRLQSQLHQLAKRTKGNPTDADADIDFAYRNMALPTMTPLEAPSTSAWEWYLFARNDRDEFLKICAKREDAKAKMAGTITNQRMDDDKRQQFAVIDRLEKALTLDVAAIIKELMTKFPDDVLRECRKFDDAWNAFLAKEPG